VNGYWFEIKRLGNHQFVWSFMEAKNGQLRSLARGTRDYNSRQDAEDAINALKEVFGGADILERLPHLPESHFELHKDAVPLVVGERHHGRHDN
jgi:uncharacterized protein YegP (UPF0339 family)